MARRVLADTTAWIEFFRGSRAPAARVLKATLREGATHSIGVVRLELLAGAKTKRDLAAIRNLLAQTVAVATVDADYEAAGLLVYRLRRKGITVHALDALIAAVAIREDLSLLTTDPDFRPISDHEGLKILAIEA